MSSVDLLFLGTGTSAGIPMIGCHCAVCTSADPHDRRTRPSVVVSYDDVHVLIDTTPELRLQAVANGVEKIDAIVFTHAHADHIMGLDDARRFNMIRNGPIDTYASADAFGNLTRCFGYAFKDPSDPLIGFRPHLVKRLIDGRFTIGEREWIPLELQHDRHRVLGFRVGPLAYCTDVSFMPEKTFDALTGVDVLVLDALGWKPHPAHFSVDQAVEVARRIGARQTWLTHIGHSLQHAGVNAKLPDEIRLAHDGLRVTSNG